MGTGDDTDDTVIRQVLGPPPTGEDLPVRLARTAVQLQLLADVYSAYPRRHSQVWQSAAWAKDLKDFELACEQLRRHAADLRAMSDELDRRR